MQSNIFHSVTVIAMHFFLFMSVLICHMDGYFEGLKFIKKLAQEIKVSMDDFKPQYRG